MSFLNSHSLCILIGLYNSGIYFYFDRRPIKLSCNVLLNRLDNVDTTKGAVPSVAYIDRDRIDGLRYQKLQYYMGRRASPQTRAIINLHVKKITPADRCHDPYLFALLLAVAFQQQWVLEDRGTPKSIFLV